MITAGIDCGAKNTKAVILKDGEVIGKAMVLTGSDPVEAVRAAFDTAAQAAGIQRSEVESVAGTGSGRNAVKAADQRVDDIRAMGKGAFFRFPGARTVVDVGAEEARAGRLDDQGNAEDFAVNEKCAAGAGVFIETMSRALETPLEELGPLALASDQSIPMNAQCAVFAESEVVGLIHAGAEKKDISRAIHDAMADRIATMIRRVGVNRDLVMIGGVARNPAVVEALKRELRLETIHVPDDPEYTAAVGAAVVAAGEMGKVSGGRGDA
ncbi:MAG: acyl-CoA dehydratase activase [Deltaproteobacteria bacterium]|nr:acyl-CoA dehydratase activase [Deltaproteobacteria bacterium]